jgi:fumarate hydratase subunit beta
MKRISLPITEKSLRAVNFGDELLLCGKLYTARDAAHKRFYHAIKKRQRLPIDIKGNILYYCGPAPAKPGSVIGSCGPTTSSRMDIFTPLLLKMGLAGTIGKGTRSEEVLKAIKEYGRVYFAAIGGAGAYLSTKVKQAKVACYGDLGPEAVYEFIVEDFPVIAAIDSKGRSIFAKQDKAVCQTG